MKSKKHPKTSKKYYFNLKKMKEWTPCNSKSKQKTKMKQTGREERKGKKGKYGKR